ncbi:hypothetical protein F5880DRAFT_1512366, partial [Lentinula raphanica]
MSYYTRNPASYDKQPDMKGGMSNHTHDFKFNVHSYGEQNTEDSMFNGKSHDKQDIGSGMFNYAQNFTVTDPTFNVAGRDMITQYYLSTEEESKLREWLSAPDCSTNYTTALSKRVAGTCQWIFEDPTYLKWKEEGSILWIQGKAGSGKTFLITSIIEDFEKMNCLSVAIYYYFDIRDNIGTKLSFRGLLLSLIMQLGAQDQKIHPALQILHKSSKHGLSQFKPTDDKLMETLTEIIKDLVQKEHQIHIIVDALDECKDAHSVIRFIDEIANLCPVKAIISSRSYQSENHPYSTISLNNNDMVDQDIATFVEMQITFRNTILKTEVRELLLSKADGGFRYIDCQIQSLKKCTNAKGVHQALAQLPSDLNEIYVEAIAKCQKSFHAEDVHHILLWLLYSFEPLNLSQVATILAIDLNSSTVELDTEMLIGLEEIVDTTLVTVDKQQIVQLAHASVKEFLLESQDNLLTKILFNINAQLAHNMIAQIFILGDLKPFENWKKNFRLFTKQGKDGMTTLDNKLDKYVNTPDAEIGTPLHGAALQGNDDIVKFLIDYGADINAKGGHYGTAIEAAALYNHERVIEHLLTHGADMNAQAGYYGTAIQAAAQNGHTDVVELLIEHGADVNISGGNWG